MTLKAFDSSELFLTARKVVGQGPLNRTWCNPPCKFAEQVHFTFGSRKLSPKRFLTVCKSGQQLKNHVIEDSLGFFLLLSLEKHTIFFVYPSCKFIQEHYDLNQEIYLINSSWKRSKLP